MKTVLVITVLVFFRVGYSQEAQKKKIDEIVDRIEATEYFYTADLTSNIIGEDSVVVGWFSISYRYTDPKGKNLIKANQFTNSYRDSSSIDYYFNNRSLIKVDVHRIIQDSLHIQVLYFKDGQLLYSNLQSDIKFSPQTYLDNSKALLSFKTNNYMPSFIR